MKYQDVFIKLIKATTPNFKEIQQDLSEKNNGLNQLEKDLNFIEEQLKNPLDFTNTSDKNVVILLGTTGTGKTTFSAYLSGYDLVVRLHKKRLYLDYQDPSNEENRKIGNSQVNSETVIPNKFTPCSSQFQEAPYKIWDCPGFVDSRGEAQDVVNSTYIAQIFKHAECVRFILLLDYNGINTGRGEQLKVVLESLLFFQYGTSLDFSKNLLIVVTKTEQTENEQKEEIDEFLNELENNKNKSGRFQKFQENFPMANLFSQLRKAPIAVFPKPSGQHNPYPNIYRQDILNKINELTPFHINNKPNQTLNQIGKNTINYLHAPFTISSYEIINALWIKKREEIKKNYNRICHLIIEQLKMIEKYSSFQEANKILTNLINTTGKTNEEFITNFTYNVQQLFKLLDDDMVLEGSSLEGRKEIQNKLADIKQIASCFYDGLFRHFPSLGKEINTFFGIIGEYERAMGTSLLKQGQDQLGNLLKYKKHQTLGVIGVNQQNKNKNTFGDFSGLSESKQIEVQHFEEEIKKKQASQISKEIKSQQVQAIQNGNTLTDPSKNYIKSGLGGAGLGTIAAGTLTVFTSFTLGPLLAVGVVGGALVGTLGKLFSWW